MTAMRNRNKTGNEHCAACDDSGWVELTTHRGMAPCKWCEWGAHHWQRNPGLVEDFRGEDIVLADQKPGRRFVPSADFLRNRVQAGCSIASLQASFPRRIWPSEWDVEPPKPNPLADSEAVEVAEKVETARVALETASQEPLSAVGASGADPDYGEITDDDIPF